MTLVRPHLVVLDSATLGNASRDYWSREPALRERARGFIARLRDRGVYITFTFMHVLELLRHDDEAIVRDRLKFLQGLPFIAWLRPYDRNWFPGAIPDLFRRELHAVVHDGKRDWRNIIQQVRADLWETGVGSEMFVDNDDLWKPLRVEAKRHQAGEVYVASVARTDPGDVNDLTVSEARQLAMRPKAERPAYLRRFVATMEAQLEKHGDPRLPDSRGAAATFANDLLGQIEMFEAAGGDPIERMLKYHGVPPDLVTDSMTVADVGQLAVYIKQLGQLSNNLNPRAAVTVRSVPPATLPSYVVQREFSIRQCACPGATLATAKSLPSRGVLRSLRDAFVKSGTGTTVQHIPDVGDECSLADLLVIAELLRVSMIAFLTPEEVDEQRGYFGFRAPSRAT